MGLSIGIKEFEYPEWVNAVYANLSDEARAKIVKTDIYSACDLAEDDSYNIIPFVGGLSNRVPSGHDAESCAVAISMAETIYPWTYLPGTQKQQWVCKHCKHTFETRAKDPRCEACKKWNWMDIKKD